MPSTPRKGTKGYYIELPPGLVEAFDGLAARTGRTRTLEIVRAMRRHLDYPEVQTPVGPLLGDEPVAAPRPRGRPKKGGGS